MTFRPSTLPTNFPDMVQYFIRVVIGLALGLILPAGAQEIPLDQPRMLPFPQLSVSASYLALVPTQNLMVKSVSGGWNIHDTLRAVAATLDLELLRYHWGQRFLPDPRMDIYSSLGYSSFKQLGTTALPGSYPSDLLLNETLVTGFGLRPLIREFYLGHTFSFQYSGRGSMQANLATGFAHLDLYLNEDGVRALSANGFGLHFGLGWKYRLWGRPGKRLLLGVDLAYSLRSFDLAGGDESLGLPNGSNAAVTPIQSISLNTPDVRLSLDMGELLFGAYTPYRDPYRLGLITLGIGYGLNAYTGGTTLQFDSTGIEFAVPMAARLGRNLDLQLIKYNWPFHFLKQANIDLFSGLGFRIWRSNKRAVLPVGWAHDLTDGSQEFSSMQFGPRLLDIYLNHEIIYPLGPRLHFKVSAGTGFAIMSLYENVLLQRLVDANSLTWQLGTGLGFTIQGDGSSKVALGLGIHYYHQAFDFDRSASNLSPVNAGEWMPITRIDLSQPVFALELGLIFGGNPNAASKAYEAFKKKRFSQALEIQTELLKQYPDHHNRGALLIQKQQLEDSLVTHYYQDVRTILDQGKLENALTLISRGKKPPGDAVDEAVRDMRLEIAEEALGRAKTALQRLDHEEAEKNILLALKSDPRSLNVAKALLSRSYIIRATILYQAGVYNRSLYWLKQADGLSDRYRLVTENLRRKIGDGRLDDANEGILKEDRHMVYESMQDAKTLNPSLADIVDPHLQDLQQAIQRIDEQTIGPLKRMALDNLLDDVDGLSPDNFNPQVGMKGVLIARYVGPPARKFQEGDYELWVYPRTAELEVWLYLQNGLIEKIEYKTLD